MSMLQLLGGVAVAGVVAAGTTAMTGSGLVWAGSSGGVASQFVGGTLTQTVAGATITDVVYGYTNASNSQTDSIAITVTGAAGMYLTVTPDGALGGSPTVADGWQCTPAGGTIGYHATAPKVQIPAGPSNVVTCKPEVVAGPHSIVGTYDTGLANLVMAVTTS
ncbi:MAG TPA: hypothetical protein VGD29_24000 [Actinoplanes sp.]